MSNATVEVDGLTVRVYRGEEDNKLVVEITGPGDEDLIGLGTPDMRVWLNEDLIHDPGEYGPKDIPKDITYPVPLDDNKPIPHVEVVLGVDKSTIGLNFEEGVPEELQELIRGEIVRLYQGLRLDNARVNQVEAEVNFMLVSMNEQGVVLRDPRFPGRVWDFDVGYADLWLEHRRNPPATLPVVFPMKKD